METMDKADGFPAILADVMVMGTRTATPKKLQKVNNLKLIMRN